MKIGILGSGILGLAAAYRLSKNGHQVTILERSDSIGGLLASEKVGNSYLERFYHHIFRSDKEIISLIEEVGLGEKLEWEKPNTSIYFKGKIYRFDSPLSVLLFPPLPFLDRLRVGLGAFYLKIKKDYTSFENVTAYQWINKWMGRKSWEVVWGPLFGGKFTDLAKEVIMPWFWSRVHLRSAALGYLRGGFYHLYLRLAEKIKEYGGEVKTSQEVTEIRNQNGKVKIFTKSDEFEFDSCLVTIPTTLFFNLASLPEEYKNKYTPPLHYGAVNIILFLKRKLSGVYWLNISDPDFPFLVFVEHTNFRDKSEYDGKHIIYLGNYLPTDHPIFKENDKVILKKYLPHLKKINPDFESDWIEDYIITKAPFAQPVVTLGYKKKLPPHETPLKNVYLANMSQVYPEDRGQNYSVKLAEKVVKKYFPQR